MAGIYEQENSNFRYRDLSNKEENKKHAFICIAS